MEEPIPTMQPDELRAIREELGLKLREMAARMGVKLRTYQSWEATGESSRPIQGPAVLLAKRLLEEHRLKKS